MCNNIVVLYMFMLLKLVSLVILPVTIFIKRNWKHVNILIIVDIIMVLFFLLGNIFNSNSCIYNSTLSGIERTNNNNKIIVYNELHPWVTNDSLSSIEPNTNYRTYNNNTLYYYNQNSDSIKDSNYECNGNKVYANTYASGITAFTIATSTLYNSPINPIELFNAYKESHDVCNEEISSSNLITFFTSRYNNLKVDEINSSQLESAIKYGNVVVAELSANENSKLTCDSGYIVIFNIGLDGKYMIADPSLLSKDFICPYSSKAYGNIIKSDNMNKSWYLSEINNEVIHYYSLYTN